MVLEYYVDVTPTLFQNQQMKIEVTVMWFLSRQLVIAQLQMKLKHTVSKEAQTTRYPQYTPINFCRP